MKVPTLLVRRFDSATVYAWCPCCGSEHAHGISGGGHRAAHCPPESLFSSSGYVLKAPASLVEQMPPAYRGGWRHCTVRLRGVV